MGLEEDFLWQMLMTKRPSNLLKLSASGAEGEIRR